jgi:hypothetical protein
MTFKVIAEAEAKRDWNEAVDWYEEREPGIGLRLDDTIRTFLQNFFRQPGRFPFAAAPDARGENCWTVALLGFISRSTPNIAKSKCLPSGTAAGIPPNSDDHNLLHFRRDARSR